jgi:type 1 fimbriae regulatory protein FimB/type 1 fimbriae regulatory protein FimE
MQPNHYLPTRQKNKQLRDREHLSPQEVEKLITAAKSIGRHRLRDSTMILLSYRHGLRISELVTLKWSQIDLEQGYVHVLRRKNGIDATHPLFGPELRALRKVQKDYPSTDYVFISERKAPVTEHVFRKILKRAGEIARLNSAWKKTPILQPPQGIETFYRLRRFCQPALKCRVFVQKVSI